MTQIRPPRLLLLTALTAAACAAYAQVRPFSAPAVQVSRDAQPVAAAAPANPGPQASVLRPCASVSVDPPTHLALGKSRVIRLDFPAVRMVVGGMSSSRAGVPIEASSGGSRQPGMQGGGQPAAARSGGSDGVADTEITLLSPTELYFLGKKTGSMNVVLQSAEGRCVVKDIIVTVDPATLQAQLTELLPDEKGIKVRGAENTLVLTGSVTDIVKLDQVMLLAAAYGGGEKVVNMLRVSAPQQVMLEVQIAEVSKNLLDKFGLDYTRLVTSANGLTQSIFSGIIGGGAGLLGRFRSDYAFGAVGGDAGGTAAGGSGTAGATLGSVDRTPVYGPDGSRTGTRITYGPGTIGKSASLLGVDAQKKDGIVRVLAEPNIMAISGQQASFLSGGKIFIPVAQANNIGGGTTITLEEKEFGVGLKFTPTVLDGRINLKLVSEVSELSQTGSPFTAANGAVAILPSISTRRVDTTVQLGDGQSFVVAGLIKNNMNGALDRFPGLGEIPVAGALFRSTEFQTDQTELMFVVTPRLVRPLGGSVVLPTDNHTAPSRKDVMLMGIGEGQPPLTTTAPPAR